jgi:hypothetical protein
MPSSSGLVIVGTRTPYSRTLSTVCCIAVSSLMEKECPSNGFSLSSGIHSMGSVEFFDAVVLFSFNIVHLVYSMEIKKSVLK